MIADDHEVLIAREKPVMDGALPSGNAVALMNLLRLNALILIPSYLKRAESGFAAFSTVLEANPSAFGEMLLALDDFLHPPDQVIIVTPGRRGYLPARPIPCGPFFCPGSLIMMVTESNAVKLSQQCALFRQKTAAGGRATAYVCQNGSCRLPVTTADALMQQLTAS